MMARREVIEVTCDRCERTETQAKDSMPKIPDGGAELTLNFHGETVKYVDLCKRCRDAIKNYVGSITKKKDEEPKPPVKLEDKKKGFLGGRAG
jgi:hypothetical protein